MLQLVKTELFGRRRDFQLKKRKGSEFRKGLMSISEDVARRLICMLGNGKKKKIRFWLDVKLGNCALKIVFSELSAIRSGQYTKP